MVFKYSVIGKSAIMTLRDMRRLLRWLKKEGEIRVEVKPFKRWVKSPCITKSK